MQGDENQFILINLECTLWEILIKQCNTTFTSFYEILNNYYYFKKLVTPAWALCSLSLLRLLIVNLLGARSCTGYPMETFSTCDVIRFHILPRRSFKLQKLHWLYQNTQAGHCCDSSTQEGIARLTEVQMQNHLFCSPHCLLFMVGIYTRSCYTFVFWVVTNQPQWRPFP